MNAGCGPSTTGQLSYVVITMSDAHKIIADARETLRRIDGIEDEFAHDAYVRERRHVEMWDLPAAPSQKETTEMTTQIDWDSWNEWAEQHVARGAEEVASIIGEEVHQIQADLLKRIQVLETALGELTASVEVERAARNSNVFDLPANFLRRTNDAA